MKSIVLNSTNVIQGSSNSVYQFDFPKSYNFKKSSKLALQSLAIPYSWYNITAAYNNNQIKIVYNNITNIMTLPDGWYDITAINSALQNFTLLSSNNLPYAIDNNGNYIYFIEFIYNITNYSVQLNSYPCNLSTNWTNPKNAILNGYCPQITIPNNMSLILGLPQNTLMPLTNNVNSNYSTQSSFYGLIPNFNPVNAVIVRCDLLYSQYSNPSDVLFSFNTQNQSFGNNIAFQNSSLALMSIASGNKTGLKISFYDQNYNRLNILDNNLVIQLLIYDGEE